MEITFPVYLLRLGKETRVVFPDGKGDIGHTEFWEHTVHAVVADHYKIPRKRLLNVPYCQRRARIVGNRVYYGGKRGPELLAIIKSALGNKTLVFVPDNHERRLNVDFAEFKRLVRLYRTNRRPEA